MPKRSSNPADLNRLASAIVQASTTDDAQDADDEKNPAAVELGRKGGLKGGKARAEKLTSDQRSEIARNAALARWSRRNIEKSRRGDVE